MWRFSHVFSLIRRFRTRHTIEVNLCENDISSASICTDNDMQTRTCVNKPCLSAHLKYRFPKTDPAGLSHKHRWNTQIVASFLRTIELGTGIRTNRNVIMTKSVRTSMIIRVETSWTEALGRGATQYCSCGNISLISRLSMRARAYVWNNVGDLKQLRVSTYSSWVCEHVCMYLSTCVYMRACMPSYMCICVCIWWVTVVFPFRGVELNSHPNTRLEVSGAIKSHCTYVCTCYLWICKNDHVYKKYKWTHICTYVCMYPCMPR